MIEFTADELTTRTAHIQRLAQNRPVLISDGEHKQVLMTYDDYLKLGGEPQSQNQSFYETFFGNMPPELANALAKFDDDESEILSSPTKEEV